MSLGVPENPICFADFTRPIITELSKIWNLNGSIAFMYIFYTYIYIYIYIYHPPGRLDFLSAQIYRPPRFSEKKTPMPPYDAPHDSSPKKVPHVISSWWS